MTSNFNDNLVRAHQRQNFIQTVLLLGGMGIVLVISTALLWGLFGVAVALIVLGVIIAFAQHVPPEAVMRLYRAQHLARDGGQLSRIVDELSVRAELPARPEVYVIPSATLNAFATGTPERSAIAITEGLLRNLTMREMIGVLAHEVSHIRNHDLWLMGVADILSRLVQPLTYVAIAITVFNLLGSFAGEPPLSWVGVLLLYFAPAISNLLQLALSRTREFDADADALALTGDPMGLASALRRLDHLTGSFWEDVALPVPSRRVPQPSMLRTHPPIEDRVERILALSNAPSYEPIVVVEEPSISVVTFGPSEIRPRYRFPGVWF